MGADELRDREAIRELIASYCFFVDASRWRDWSELFIEDCTLQLADGRVLHGRQAVYDSVANVGPEGRIREIKHIASNVVIRFERVRAHVDSYYVILRRNDDGLRPWMAG